MSVTPAKLLADANKIKSTIVEYRRKIHSNPELSFDENETARLITSALSDMGYAPRTGIAGTCVVADIGSTTAGGKLIALRADMDGLPIHEGNDVEYRSKIPGVMHACGHDAHTACLLGAAKLIAENPPRNGRIRLVFQPAEEATNSDGMSGAQLIYRAGVFDGVESLVGLHVAPDYPPGAIALRVGPLLAACDSFDIKIQGRGSHGAYPHLGVDPIVAATHVIQAIQLIISRKRSALEPALITIGGIKSSSYVSNIVPDSVELTGTVRYFEPAVQAIIKRELDNACKIAETLGGSYTLHYQEDGPALTNDQRVVEAVRSVANQMLGAECVLEAQPIMAAEDFSYLSQKLPSCYIFLGAELAEGRRMVHTATFDIDEEALPIGAAILAASGLALCEA